MIKVIYPKGSIISIKDDKKLCIVEINDNSYGCVMYPYGLLSYNSIIDVKFDEVENVYFWGYKNKKYENKLKKLIINSLLKDDE